MLSRCANWARASAYYVTRGNLFIDPKNTDHGDVVQAKKDFQRVVDELTTRKKPDFPLGEAYRGLAQIAQRDGNFKEALQNAKKAYQVFKDVYSDNNHPDNMQTRELIEQLREQMREQTRVPINSERQDQFSSLFKEGSKALVILRSVQQRTREACRLNLN